MVMPLDSAREGARLMSLTAILFTIVVEPLQIMFASCMTLLGLLTHNDTVSCTVIVLVVAGLAATYIYCAVAVRRTRDALIEDRVKGLMRLLNEHGSPCVRRAIFLVSIFVLVVLTGVVIPLALAETMPQTFTFFSGVADEGTVTDSATALPLIVRPLCLALGTYALWPSVLYALPGERHRRSLEVLMVVLVCIAIVDYHFFGTNEEAFAMLRTSSLTAAGDGLPVANMLAVVVTCVLMGLASRRFPRVVLGILVVMAVGTMGLAARHISGFPATRDAVLDATAHEAGQPHFTLSKTGKNVVVLMLDRGMGEYVPYIMNEKPELKEQFVGFTYYPNTISFGAFTNFGVPALLGGYEYTPVEMNRRTTERLQDKHDEALKVMPAIFDQSGYDVTVCDPPYAGYQWESDLSIYSPYPNIHAYNTMGYFTGMAPEGQQMTGAHCDLFRLALARVVPLPCRQPLYRSGVTYTYGADPSCRGVPLDVSVASGQTVSDNALVADGGTDAFLRSYYALNHLVSMTRIGSSTTGSFLMMANDTTHEPMILQEPSYTPSQHVDNSAYEAENHDRFTVNGERLVCENSDQYMHYQTNVATLAQVGRWLDYLREQGVYDNTRIIICADHGRPLHQLASRILSEDSGLYDTESYAPCSWRRTSMPRSSPRTSPS